MLHSPDQYSYPKDKSGQAVQHQSNSIQNKTEYAHMQL